MDTAPILAAVMAIVVGMISGTLDALHSREFITLLNTTLNAASWWMLIKAQRRLRTEVAPKLAHVEQQVGTVVAAAERMADTNTNPPSAVQGGRREYDPPTGEDETTTDGRKDDTEWAPR